jgi:hypothetical protein
MTIMGTVIGWLIWGILAAWTAAFTFGFVNSYRKGEVIQWASVNQVVLLWLICAWTLVKPALPRLHLLWLVPLAVVLPMLTTPWIHLRWSRPGPRTFPPGLILFLILFGAILLALTP